MVVTGMKIRIRLMSIQTGVGSQRGINNTTIQLYNPIINLYMAYGPMVSIIGTKGMKVLTLELLPWLQEDIVWPQTTVNDRNKINDYIKAQLWDQERIGALPVYSRYPLNPFYTFSVRKILEYFFCQVWKNWCEWANYNVQHLHQHCLTRATLGVSVFFTVKPADSMEDEQRLLVLVIMYSRHRKAHTYLSLIILK